ARVIKAKDGWLPKQAFFDEYVTFADDHEAPVKTPEQVGRQLPGLVPSVRAVKHRVAGQQVPGWAGIDLRGAPPDPDDRQTALDIRRGIENRGAADPGETGETGYPVSAKQERPGDS